MNCAKLILGSEYWTQARRPLVSLVFIAPILCVYEFGVLTLPHGVRNGADVWLRQWLDLAGLKGYFLLPVGTVAILLAWHHLSCDPWKLRPWSLAGMLAECGVLALVLLSAAWLARLFFSPPPLPVDRSAVALWNNVEHSVARIIAFCGAGIYEEVLFRLLLLPAVMRLLGVWMLERRMQTWGAVLVTSAAFSIAHYVGAHGDPWAWNTFAFRSFAGIFFAVLFVYRGFGIAAGTHTFYDIVAGIRLW